MKRIYIIINPAAGADYPILSLLHRRLQNRRMNVEILVTQRKGDIVKYTQKAIEKGIDAVAVYGGDGSIMEAAKVLYKTDTPLIILPGGTANILAKELGVPVVIENAIDVLFQKRKKIKKIDVGLCNNAPFFLRVSIGLLADMVINANPTLKKSFGQLAYPITAVQSLSQIEQTLYKLTVDGDTIEDSGYSLVVANSGNIGFSGISMLPDVSVTDDLLNIVLIKNALDPTTKTLTHWKGKKITVSQGDQKHQILRDDDIVKADILRFSIAPHKLHVLVP